MFDLMKKTMLTGIGLALRTKNEVEELSKELVEIGKLNEEEGKKFLDEMLAKYNTTRKEFEDKIETSVRDFFLKTEEEGKQALDDLKKTLDERKSEIEKIVDQNVKNVMEKSGIVSVTEIKALKDEITALRQEIANLKK